MPMILCIDDDPRILELQTGILETKGYTVLTAPDGRTGLTLASTHPIDVVVLDFKMPGMNGDEVAEVLLKEVPNLPIVICTGFFDAVPQWLRWFAAAYLQKEDGPDLLLSTIEEVLAKKKVSSSATEGKRSAKAGVA